MLSRRRSRSLQAFLLALMVVPPVAVVAAIPWMKRQPDDVGFLLTGTAATVTVLASLVLGVLHDRRVDEWHRSAARFSSQWGWTAGASLVALLLAWPPTREFIVSWPAVAAGEPDPDRELVLLTFVAGFMTVVVAQLVCTALLAVGWTYWMSRSARETHEE